MPLARWKKPRSTSVLNIDKSEPSPRSRVRFVLPPYAMAPRLCHHFDLRGSFLRSQVNHQTCSGRSGRPLVRSQVVPSDHVTGLPLRHHPVVPARAPVPMAPMASMASMTPMASMPARRHRRHRHRRHRHRGRRAPLLHAARASKRDGQLCAKQPPNALAKELRVTPFYATFGGRLCAEVWSAAGWAARGATSWTLDQRTDHLNMKRRRMCVRWACGG